MQQLVQTLINSAIAHKATLAVAESCTGGRIASEITAVSGASAIFLGGVIAYDNAVKHALLGVSQETLEKFGAVSAETAYAMANGVRNAIGATHAIATTGIAGPTGATHTKPVGRVYIALATAAETRVERFQFTGSRNTVQRLATDAALRILLTSFGVQSRQTPAARAPSQSQSTPPGAT